MANNEAPAVILESQPPIKENIFSESAIPAEESKRSQKEVPVAP